jgi:thioredoxin-dependent peroxiredoxin
MKESNAMKINVNQPAPAFQVSDVFGESIDLQKLKGRMIYMAFQRNVGCPVCNLRVHELLKNALRLNENAAVILIYESTREKMLEYLDHQEYPFHFVSDPHNRLFELYSIERSWSKLVASLFNGIASRAMTGKKLFNKPIAQDGNTNTIPAEFVINESGKVTVAHYGKFVGDHLPLNELMEALVASRIVV